MKKELNPKNHDNYDEMISIIERARENAFRAVNHELISMYWEIGAYVSKKVKNGGWGEICGHRFRQIYSGRTS